MFKKDLENFCNNLRALREFAHLIDTVLHAEGRSFVESRRADVIPYLVGAKYLAQSGGPLADKFAGTAEGLPPIDVLRQHFDGNIALDESGMRLSGPGSRRYEEAAKAIDRMIRRNDLLYGNVLISLIGAAEWLLSRLIRHHFLLFPDSASIKDKTIAFTQLKTFTSIDHVRDHLIEERLIEVMWGGIDKWLDFLETKLKVPLTQIQDNRDVLCEVYLRRNIIADSEPWRSAFRTDVDHHSEVMPISVPN